MKHKNILCLFVLLFVVISLTNSFAEAENPVKGYGFKIGYVTSNHIWKDNDDSSRDDDRNGLDFCFFLELNINSSYLNYLFEIHYIEKGCNDDLLYCDVYGNCYDKTFENKITYLSIPFIFKFSIPNDYISPFFVIGPRVDLKLSYKSELMENTYEEFKEVIFGYDYGFGLETKVKDLTIEFVTKRNFLANNGL